MEKANKLKCIDNLIWIGLLAAAFFSLLDFLIRTSFLPAWVAAGWDEALIAFMVGLWFLKKKLSQEPLLMKTPVNLPLAALALAALLSIAVNRVPLFIAVEALRVLLQGAAFYFIAANLIQSQRQIKVLTAVMLVAVTIIAVYGIYQYAVGIETPTQWIVEEFEEGIRTRVYSTVGNPNALAGYMILFLPTALALTLKSRRKILKILCGLSFLLLLLCLVFTFSRGAWLGFLGSLVVLGFVLDRRILVLLLVGLAAAPVLLPGTIIDRMLFVFSQEYISISTVYGRLSAWRKAAEIMLAQPLFGAGLGTVGDSVATRRDLPGAFWVDNQYLRIGAEMGVTGLLLFLWLMKNSVLSVIGQIRGMRDPFFTALLGGIAAGLSAVVIQNATVSVFEVLFVSTYWWFLVGIAWAAVRLYWRRPAKKGGEAS